MVTGSGSGPTREEALQVLRQYVAQVARKSKSNLEEFQRMAQLHYELRFERNSDQVQALCQLYEQGGVRTCDKTVREMFRDILSHYPTLACNERVRERDEKEREEREERERLERKRIAEIDERRARDPIDSALAVVISDVHLGVANQSHGPAFYELLAKCKDTKIYLLGDILDLWIYAESLDDAGLAQHLSSHWKELHSNLSKAAERGCEIHYVPGNHDAFVYFVEAAEVDEWSRAILARTPLLLQIQEQVRNHSLLRAADMHYPCWSLDAGAKRILLTHGHYHGQYWRLMVGLEESGSVPDAVLGASIVLAHKHARLLRRANNNLDWLLRTQRIEDVGISITNALLVAYEGALQMAKDKPDDLVGLVDTAIALYFGTNQAITQDEELRIRESLLFMHKNRERDQSKLESVREGTRRFLKSGGHGSSVTLSLRDNVCEMTAVPLQTFAEFDALVFGHTHAPGHIEDVYNSGGFVGHVETYVAIYDDGTFRQPENLLPR